MKSTIKDIARDTKLSLATISKYINGKNVLPENKKLIEESIKKLGYIPNKTAQNLRSKRIKTICIILPKIGDYFLGSLCSLIEEHMRHINYSTIIASYDPHTGNNSSELEILLKKQVDGVILVPDASKIGNVPIVLKNKNIPFVCLEQPIQGVSADVVASDNRSAAYNATKYLINSGHRILGIITEKPASYISSERLHGFLDACSEYDIPEKDCYIYNSDIHSQSSVEYFKNMIKQTPSPTAVLICGYRLTLGIILTLNDLGLTIPKDFSLISFDDDQIFSAFQPPITVVTENMEELAKQASRLLIKRINGNTDSFPETIIVETKLIIRKSVGLVI